MPIFNEPAVDLTTDCASALLETYRCRLACSMLSAATKSSTTRSKVCSRRLLAQDKEAAHFVGIRYCSDKPSCVRQNAVASINDGEDGLGQEEAVVVEEKLLITETLQIMWASISHGRHENQSTRGLNRAAVNRGLRCSREKQTAVV